MNRLDLRVAPEQLRYRFDAATLGFETLSELEPLEGIVGQERAAAALRFGLGVQAEGFHIFVAGPPSIGKMTMVRLFLEEMAKQKPTPPDWCYVHNYDDPYQPLVLELPPGRGRELQQDMRHLLEQARRELPRAFESEEYTNRRDELGRQLDQERNRLMESLGEKAQQNGFLFQVTPIGIALIPLIGGRPISEQDYQALPAPIREEIQQRRTSLETELKQTLRQIRELERHAREQLEQLDRQVALAAVGGLMEDLIEKYSDLPAVRAYLERTQQDILENIGLFRGERPAWLPEGMPIPLLWLQEVAFRKYQVNVLVDNSKQLGAPVIIEHNPSHSNLFGRVEKEAQFGALYTDFTLIKPGSLHRANGGYLIIPIEELLRSPFSYESLLRALRSGQIEIEDPFETIGFAVAKTIRPQPMPLRAKIILVGPPLYYYLLSLLDDEFGELFRVRAEFDTRMELNERNQQNFLRFLCSVCCKQNLLPLDNTGAARMLEYAMRLASDQQKLSTHFGSLVSVVLEAHYWAMQDSANTISARHVDKALEQKVYRSSLLQERIQELIRRGVILIDTQGEAIGQVNGLSVINLVDYEFGRPSRITATVRPGSAGIVDIEREVKLGGPIHSKGVMILTGYLAATYLPDAPLTLSARLVFEQSYEGVEGDSASSAELFALLSAIANVPLKQSIAVTGSVNQRGEIQAIGGVNEKIEGFYEVCKAHGLTGEQGVIIPKANLQHLMLKDEVVEAVREGKFHIWAISHVNEGLEILSGLSAGERDADGKFPEGSFNARVEGRLREFSRLVQQATRFGESPPSSEE
ncbi:Lon protease [bacterium HR15]|nr:Lon protease [bacterium HR15]